MLRYTSWLFELLNGGRGCLVTLHHYCSTFTLLLTTLFPSAVLWPPQQALCPHLHNTLLLLVVPLWLTQRTSAVFFSQHEEISCSNLCVESWRQLLLHVAELWKAHFYTLLSQDSGCYFSGEAYITDSFHLTTILGQTPPCVGSPPFLCPSTGAQCGIFAHSSSDADNYHRHEPCERVQFNLYSQCRARKSQLIYDIELAIKFLIQWKFLRQTAASRCDPTFQELILSPSSGCAGGDRTKIS